MDFLGIDAIVFGLRHEHIAVRASGDDHNLTATEAADRVKAANEKSRGGITPYSIPAPQRYITMIAISGGVQYWGSWDF